MPIITVFDHDPLAYDTWFDTHAGMFEAELAALQTFIPPSGLSIEVGVGTGRFAARLGIKFGIDPSHHMLQLARQRGLPVCQAIGEQLPFVDGQFDLVLLVTVICFVDDVPALLRELRRVLKSGGQLVIGFINRHSVLGQVYESRKERSAFYRDARFYSVTEVADWVRAAGFDSLRYCETLLGNPEDYGVTGLEVRDGDTQGAFVVLRALKHNERGDL